VNQNPLQLLSLFNNHERFDVAEQPKSLLVKATLSIGIGHSAVAICVPSLTACLMHVWLLLHDVTLLQAQQLLGLR
jgi:hypothetical protein